VHEWETAETIDATSDLSGNIYLTDNNGAITKFDQNGIYQISYSGSGMTPVSSIDVSHITKIFGFYQESQSYILLDRFLNPLTASELNPATSGFVTAAAYGADNNLWIFDQSNLSIKRINLLNDVLITSNAVPLLLGGDEWDLIQMEEYQNRLYLLNMDKKVYVFDNLGNYIRELEIRSDCKFSFQEGKLMYVRDGEVMSYDLYDNTQSALGRINNSKGLIKVISNNNFIYLVHRNKISAYQ